MNKSVRGAALVIILFIAAILASTSILLIVKTKSHIERIAIIKEYMKAEREVVTDANYFIFLTKTSPYGILGDGSSIEFNKSNLPKGINLTGEPFNFRQSTFIVQDMGGLVPLLPVDEINITKYLLFLGWPKAQISIFLDVLQDWLDGDKFQRLNGAEDHLYDVFGYPFNNSLQNIKDIGLLANVDPDLLSRLANEETLLLYGVGKQTPSYAPRFLEPYFYSPLEINKISSERESDQSVSNAKGYTTGNWIIKVKTSYMNAQSSKIIHMSKRFGDIRPFVITKWQDVKNN